MSSAHEREGLQEGDFVVARRSFLLASEDSPSRSRQHVVTAGAILRLGPAVRSSNGGVFHTELLGVPAAVGLVSADTIGHAPGLGLSEQALLESLPTFAGPLLARIGKRGVRQFVQLGVHRARSHGFSETSGLHLYAGLMMQLGVDFDDDPFLPWAPTALASSSTPGQLMSEHQRVHALYVAATDYQERVLGTDQKHLRNALVKATHLNLDTLPSAGAGFVERMRRLLCALYPLRMESAAADALEQTSASYPNRADWNAPDKGLAIHVAVRFALGRGAFHDPRFPQLREVRENPARLFASLQAHLQQELRELGRQ